MLASAVAAAATRSGHSMRIQMAYWSLAVACLRLLSDIHIQQKAVRCKQARSRLGAGPWELPGVHRLCHKCANVVDGCVRSAPLPVAAAAAFAAASTALPPVPSWPHPKGTLSLPSAAFSR